jgi:hypothetical protein
MLNEALRRVERLAKHDMLGASLRTVTALTEETKA